jgi:hypothetical protein
LWCFRDSASYGFTRNLQTIDIDTLKPIESSKVLLAIESVRKKLGLGPRWLNDQASTVSIPEGTFKRSKPLSKWKTINAFLIDRIDLIKMKASAFSIRREQTIKDWEDLSVRT